MQIHPPTGFPAAIPAHLNITGETPTVYLELDGYEIVVQSMADAFMLIDAAVKAKRMLIDAGAAS